MLDLEAMKNMPVKEAVKDDLVDIGTVAVDDGFTDIGRVAEYVRQIENPYLFVAGTKIIKSSFNDNGPTFEECVRGALL